MICKYKSIALFDKSLFIRKGTTGMDGLQVYNFYSLNNLDIGKFEIVLPHVVFCWFNTL